MMDESSVRQPAASFAVLLRHLRAEAHLTQEELAEAAGLSPRSISDLERGVSRTARKETARLLANVFAMAGPVRTAFVAAARGKAPACEVVTAMENLPTSPTNTATRPCDPREDLGFGLHDAWHSQLIDAITVAVAAHSGAVAGIWFIRLKTVIASESTLPRPVRREVATGVSTSVVEPNLMPELIGGRTGSARGA